MKSRLNMIAHNNDGVDALRAVEAWLAKTLDHTLPHLIKMQASQINGCAFCLHAQPGRPQGG